MIDVNDVLETLEEVVNEAGPDYVYPYDVCAYVLEGRPVCIAARFFDKLGVSTDTMYSWDHDYDGSDVWSLHRRGLIPLDMDQTAVMALDDAQKMQDGAKIPVGRKSWGYILEIIRERAESEVA